MIAYAAGGALETVNKNTGIFFQQQTEDKLSHAVEEMETRHASFKFEEFQKNTLRFSRNRYREEMSNSIRQSYENWSKQKNERC